MIAEVVSYKKKFLVVLLLLFSIGINQYYGSRGVFPIDSFFHFDNGYRLLNGDSPFSNFWTVSGPAVDYIQAAFFFIFGVNWHSYVLHGSLLNALVTIYTFFVLKEFKLKTNFCFLYSLLFCILAYPSSGTPFVDHHSALFSLLAVYSFLLAINNKKKKHWVLIPIFSGLAFFSKQVPAAYIILTISFLLIFYSYKKKTFLYIKYCLLSSIIFIFLIFIFGKTQGIELSSFLNQYIFYPQTIGLGRLEKFHFTFQGVVAHFKFIYFAILPLLYVNYKKFYNIKNYYKRDEIYILLIFYP